MPRFKVYGADSETGEDKTVTVTADTSSDAETIAQTRGLMVAKVVELEQVPAQSSQETPAQQGSAGPHPTSAGMEKGHSAAAPAVNVHMPRRTSSLGVVSLILGIVGLLLCWIPIIGVISLPIAGVGLLLAGTGLIVALVRSGSGIGWPIGGGLVSGIALIISIVQATAIVGAGQAMSEAADEMAKQAEQREQERQRLETEWEPPEGIAKEDLSFTLGTPAVKKIPLESYQGSTTTEEAHLIVPITVQNHSSQRKLDLGNLQPDITTDRVELSDNAGNTYDSVGVPATSDLGGDMQQSATVMPGESARLHMFFERPVPGADTLKLKLPASRFDGRGHVVLETDAP